MAILIFIITALIIIDGIIYFLSVQIAAFADDLPAIKKQLAELGHTVQQWVRKKFDISNRQQTANINTATEEVEGNGGGLI